jgi:FKBP-type peptidyl-prolyl cis-trans isomerase FkpA
MKRLLVLICLLLPVLSLHARAIQEDYRRAEERAKASYAFGMILGSNLSSIDLDIDFDAFSDGVRDIIEGEAQFSEREAMEIIETVIERALDRVAVENQLREELFFAENRERPGVMVTESGLQYEVLQEAEGEKPVYNSIVRVHYIGTFLDGSPFDSSGDEAGSYIPLEMVIPGWTEGLMLMSAGSTYRLFIPSRLAYGREGIPPIIPPYSALIFTVELLEILEDEGMLDFFSDSYDDDDYYYN